MYSTVLARSACSIALVLAAGQPVARAQPPVPADVLLGRGYPGDGDIDLDRLTRQVAATGYSKDVEVEIFNADIWAADFDEVIEEVSRRYHAIVEPAL